MVTKEINTFIIIAIIYIIIVLYSMDLKNINETIITGMKGYTNKAIFSGGCISSNNIIGTLLLTDIDF